jgi:hypothetical protein
VFLYYTDGDEIVDDKQGAESCTSDVSHGSSSSSPVVRPFVWVVAVLSWCVSEVTTNAEFLNMHESRNTVEEDEEQDEYGEFDREDDSSSSSRHRHRNRNSRHRVRPDDLVKILPVSLCELFVPPEATNWKFEVAAVSAQTRLEDPVQAQNW